jgi:uncharacterized protein
MRLNMLRPLPWAVLLFMLALTASAQVALPPLTARVTDQTGTLTPPQRAALEERLAAFEARKGAQIAVVIVPTTEPEGIEQFGIRLGEKAKVGRKGVDDGAILIVALKDRALRIEVGYGLEGALPDAVTKRIIETDIVPRFKQNDYFGGIDAGVTRIMAVLDGEPLPPPKGAQPARSVGDGLEGLLILGFMLVFVVGGIIRAMMGKFLGSGVIGAIGGFAGWLMIGSIAAAATVGVIALVLSLMSGSMGGGRGRSGWASGIPGGFGGGGFGGGGWGGGGGGSWGGGGGGFGGGGASGRW